MIQVTRTSVFPYVRASTVQRGATLQGGHRGHPSPAWGPGPVPRQGGPRDRDEPPPAPAGARRGGRDELQPRAPARPDGAGRPAAHLGQAPGAGRGRRAWATGRRRSSPRCSGATTASPPRGFAARRSRPTAAPARLTLPQRINSRAVDERERVQADEAKGPPEEDPADRGREAPGRRMIGIGLVASLIGIAITLLIDWFPEPAPPRRAKIDTLYDVLLICSVPVFVLVMTIAIYSVVRFRAKPGDMGDGPPIHGNTRLEVIWVTIPFIMVTALAIYGWVALDDIEAKQKNEMVVNVTGPAVHLDVRVPGGEGQTRRSSCCRWTAGRVQDQDEGRAPLVLGPAVPAQVGRRAGPHHEDPADARQGGRLRGRLRRAVRARALHDAPVRARGAARRVRRWVSKQKQAAGGGRRRRVAAAAAGPPRRAARSSSPRTAAPAAIP